MPKIVALKEDWVKHGFEAFAEQGMAGINVEKIAASIGCNKSSFYWHFRSKKEFVDEVIRYWVKHDTEEIIAATEAGSSAKEKFLKLLELAFAEDGYVDFNFYLKRLARTRKDIADLVRDIDNKRMDYVRDLFVEMGMTKNEAAFRSSLLYKYLIGYHEMHKYEKRQPHYLDEVMADIQYFLRIQLSE